MSLAALSVLVIAFLLITGEASVIPTRSFSSASTSSSSPPSLDTSSYSARTDLLTKNIQNIHKEDCGVHEIKIQHWRTNRVGDKEWSERVLGEWCYGDDDDRFEDDGGLSRATARMLA